jgi:exopolysaccharide biosynthesis WecB/TagA/CpsF family protein
METVAWATDRMVSRRPGGIVVTPNLDFMFNVSRDPVLRRLVCESDLVVADGMPAVWLSRVLGPGLKERVTGSDLTPRLLEVCAEKGLSVFAIGGAPGVAEKAFERMRERLPGLKVAGTLSPPMAPFEKMDLQAIGERVRQADPHLVLVAMGMGKQEKLMDWLRAHTQVPLMMGVGGSLDFLAGVQKRAPRWVQRCGLEWVWRTGTAPGRFIGRYTNDGVWLLSVLSRLLWIRLGVAVRRPGGACAAPGGEEGGRVLPFPKIGTGEQQRAFLEAAGVREWRSLDLGSHDWLSSLELAALALLEMRTESGGGACSLINTDNRLRRQLTCLGLSCGLQSER